MKKLSVLILVIGVLFSCKETSKKEAEVNKNLTNKIEVIDFHSTHRCMTCNAIESNTKYTLETYFSKELKANKITFKTINVDEEENFKTAEKFEATGTSLFLNVIVDGTETAINLTDFAFMNGRDTKAFSDELKSKIDVELAKI
ncbi:nitrophenyl compound nitroreductase subunit ArsF family protein [uncultured Lutibacter sp.]|uniref:nitrophenyl compound nitroreductase subunit ArsF family protein n=1 Tax=uncultured Lutibacter sp. TaxID=437739 RepID=UPI00261CFF59|nr:nitrophenyl compound nitroreductase subunit ArsF family protein [uncultured Lutibacter sp.]